MPMCSFAFEGWDLCIALYGSICWFFHHVEPTPLIGVGEPLIEGGWEMRERKKKRGRRQNEGREKRRSRGKKSERKRKNQRRKIEKKRKGGKLRSRLICGLIELKFCQRVSDSMFFILTGWFILGISLPTFFVDVLVEPPFGEISSIFSFKGVLCLD